MARTRKVESFSLSPTEDAILKGIQEATGQSRSAVICDLIRAAGVKDYLQRVHAERAARGAGRRVKLLEVAE